MRSYCSSEQTRITSSQLASAAAQIVLLALVRQTCGLKRTA